MIAAMFTAAQEADQLQTAAVVISDPIGIVMRNAAGERVCVQDPKPVMWTTLEPNKFYCIDVETGAVGLLEVPEMHAVTGVAGFQTR